MVNVRHEGDMSTFRARPFCCAVYKRAHKAVTAASPDGGDHNEQANARVLSRHAILWNRRLVDSVHADGGDGGGFAAGKGTSLGAILVADTVEPEVAGHDTSICVSEPLREAGEGSEQASEANTNTTWATTTTTTPTTKCPVTLVVGSTGLTAYFWMFQARRRSSRV